MESKWKEAKISSGLACISLFAAAAEWSEGLRRPAVQVMMVVFYLFVSAFVNIQVMASCSEGDSEGTKVRQK